ncbi:MAG: 5-(carboxyamino)imidazole ribonucleotide synthase [Flavobacteriales bacterium]|nr:5-(carboxyamino)imidazole ribonucleotide synthase [Flavobacteriales bacterium]
MHKPIIAILGGGQLGRMFIENSLRYDVEVHVLDPDPQAPCANLAHRFVQGRFDDHTTVMRFAEHADVIGIEIEHVNVDALEELQRLGKLVVPDPRALRIIQDKGLQKEFYRANNIPTAPYQLVNDRSELAALAGRFPAFLKARTGGYDGKGVMALNKTLDIERAFDGPYVLEQRTDIALELAVIVVRALNGTAVAYDPVEMVFDPKLNLVDHLQAPARIPAKTALEAKSLALKVSTALGSPGVLAVELFLTPKGELLVNECAPRAHNSGHHTIEACASSQFDQLLRVYMGWPLGDTSLRGLAAMINLVGADGTGAPMLNGADDILHLPDTFIHLYGKSETRTGRKMGHVTVLAKDQHALDQAIAVTKVHGRVVPLTRFEPFKA